MPYDARQFLEALRSPCAFQNRWPSHVHQDQLRVAGDPALMCLKKL